MSEDGTATLTGLSASKGAATGTVFVLADGAGEPNWQNDIVLVAKEGTPDITPQVLQSEAVVLEKGSLSSHIAKVCREVGLPCVSNVDSATEKMAQWSEARVIGDEGNISRLS